MGHFGEIISTMKLKIIVLLVVLGLVAAGHQEDDEGHGLPGHQHVDHVAGANTDHVEEDHGYSRRRREAHESVDYHHGHGEPGHEHVEENHGHRRRRREAHEGADHDHGHEEPRHDHVEHVHLDPGHGDPDHV